MACVIPLGVGGVRCRHGPRRSGRSRRSPDESSQRAGTASSMTRRRRGNLRPRVSLTPNSTHSRSSRTARRWDTFTLYTTLEPCPLCVAATSIASVGRIVYAGSDVPVAAVRWSTPISSRLVLSNVTIDGPLESSLESLGAALHLAFFLSHDTGNSNALIGDLSRPPTRPLPPRGDANRPSNKGSVSRTPWSRSMSRRAATDATGLRKQCRTSRRYRLSSVIVRQNALEDSSHEAGQSTQGDGAMLE